MNIKNFMHRLLLLLLTFLTASAVWAEDDSIKIKEVVVSATKIEEPVEETTSRVVIIPRETIDSKGTEFIGDILKDIPELNLVQNGGQGKWTEVFLRGGCPSQALVMIDGGTQKIPTT